MNITHIPKISPLQSATGKKLRSKPAILIGLVIIFAILPLFIHSPYLLNLIILTYIYFAASASLRTILISGQWPLAHGAFMGVGAYVAGMASRWLDWSPWFTIPLGAFAAGAISMLFSYPFSKLRSLYYAMGSLFFGVALINIFKAGGKITGGSVALTGIQPIFVTTSKVPYYYFFLGLTLFIVIALYRFEFSRIGVNVKAVAQSYTVASSVGINESWYRILVVGFASFLVGLMGAAFGHYYGVATPTSYDMNMTFWILIYVLIGGKNSFVGPFIGVVLLFTIPEFFRGLGEYNPYLAAGITLIVVYLMPNGVMGLVRKFMSNWVDRKARKKEVGVYAARD